MIGMLWVIEPIFNYEHITIYLLIEKKVNSFQDGCNSFKEMLYLKIDSIQLEIGSIQLNLYTINHR